MAVANGGCEMSYTQPSFIKFSQADWTEMISNHRSN